MITPGAVVQTVKRVGSIPPVNRGVRGRVEYVDSDGTWVRVELPDGRRFSAHRDELAVILKTDVDL